MSEEEKVFEVKGWNHILIEGFCMVNTDYFNKKSKYVYGWERNKDPANRGRLPNLNYDPNVKPNEKPSWCEGHVGNKCLESDAPGKMCPYLAYGKVEKKVRNKFGKMIGKMYKSDY